MEKVVNKYFIGDREVTLIAEKFGTKFYKDLKDDATIYITNYEEVVAKINPNIDGIIDIDKLAITNEAD